MKNRSREELPPEKNEKNRGTPKKSSKSESNHSPQDHISKAAFHPDAYQRSELYSERGGARSRPEREKKRVLERERARLQI